VGKKWDIAREKQTGQWRDGQEPRNHASSKNGGKEMEGQKEKNGKKDTCKKGGREGARPALWTS